MFKMLLAFVLFISSYAYCGEPKTFEASPPVKKHNNNFKLKKGWYKQVKFRSALEGLTLPRHFDWREQTQLSPIKDQGDCGSCWSFATVEILQDAIAIKDKTIVNLSEQFLMSCNQNGWGCNGGDFANDMHVSPGGVYDKDFPYAGQDGVPCKPNLAHPYKLASWAYVPSASENTLPTVDEIKAAIYQYGPIGAGVAVNNAFEGYTSGIFNGCDNTPVNHAISLVGWDDDGQYWILRNSWGQEFGQNGYMYIRYGCNQVGMSANYVMLNITPPPAPTPTPKPGPTPPAPPAPPAPQPLPKCTPVAVANAGKDQTVHNGQLVSIGTPALPQTVYRWEVNGRNNPWMSTAQIKIRAYMPATFTVFATTKCGVAKSSMKLTVHW